MSLANTINSIVSISDATKKNEIAPPITFPILSSFFSPKYLAIWIITAEQNAATVNVIKLMILLPVDTPDKPTSEPNLPTTKVSTAPYIAWRISDKRMGNINLINLLEEKELNKISGGKQKHSCENLINSGFSQKHIVGNILLDEGLKVYDDFKFTPQIIKEITSVEITYGTDKKILNRLNDEVISITIGSGHPSTKIGEISKKDSIYTLRIESVLKELTIYIKCKNKK